MTIKRWVLLAIGIALVAPALIVIYRSAFGLPADTNFTLNLLGIIGILLTISALGKETKK